MVLQKFVNYHLTAAFVVPETNLQGSFKEMALEALRSRQFHVFPDEDAALNWLLNE
jgi:hypothetical protein